uniref:Uncharacterized protein n=1 Tax=Opuntia streptacantha TaxID=393608 RepID=A0A7C9EBE9_OPUST
MGFFSPLVCCWMEVRSVGMWLLLWFSVTSSFELWQSNPKVFMSTASDVMVCVACRSQANARTFPLCWPHSSCTTVYVMFFPFNFYDLWHAYLFQFLFSSSIDAGSFSKIFVGLLESASL